MKKTRTFLALAAVFALAGGYAGAEEHRTAGTVLDDTTVTAKVKAALIADPVTKAHQISVDTFKGEVKLSGFVDSVAAKRRAVEIADDIEGSMSVDDSLDVRQ